MWKTEDYISFIEDRKGHDLRYAIDASKIKKELWWKPEIEFKEWIKKTIQFYLNKKS